MDYFQLEKNRRVLAQKGWLKKLERTYFGKLPTLQDLNTDKFWNSKHQKYETFPMADDRRNIVYQFLKEKGGKILEIGFGKGILLRKLQTNKKLQIYGLDLSSQSVKNAKKKIKGEFVKGEITKLPFKSNYFDIVVVLEVLEHVPIKKNRKALKEIYRVLKKKGQLVVSVPLNEGLEEMVLAGENPNGHLRVYSPELIKAELKLSGFKIKNSRLLYAFDKLFYLKTLLTKFLPEIRKPNNIIIFANK